MRPVRALLGVLICASGWLWWRAPVIREDIDRFTAAATQKPPSKHAAFVAAYRLPDRLLVPAETEPPAPLPFVPAWARRPSPMPPPVIRTQPVEPAPLLPPDAAPELATSAHTPAPTPASSLADEAYEALRHHDRHAASRDFRAALAATPGDPRAGAWRSELAALEKRWSGSAYVLARGTGSTNLAASPVLGGGQSGARLVYLLDPLAPRPLALEARVSAPNASPGHGAQFAFGVTWEASRHANVAIERIAAPGREARGGWAARIAGGDGTVRPVGASTWLDASIYGETGAIGLHRPATYAATQGRIGSAVAIGQDLTLALDLGVWASIQHDQTYVGRADVGPSIAVRRRGLEISADYRYRVAGHARPHSGPALTVAAYF